MSTTDTPFHKWFGLSYSAYLVLPRSLLEALPTDLQQRMVDLIDEASEHITPYDGNYTVQLRGEDGRITKDPLADYRHPPANLPIKKRH